MKFETELCELAYKYGTDKCPQIKHSYTPYYYELLKARRDSIKKVLELGVGFEESIPNYPVRRKGASLYMWRDFFPNAQIYGADILPELVFKDERIETFRCDETVKEDLEKLIEKTGSDIDLFIDDGSHTTNHQVFTCLTLMPRLKKDVIYIIEDIKIVRRVEPNLKDFDCQLLNFNRNRQRDSRLIVVKHKNG